jgi:NDP-hexose-3-ketoreductase
MSGAELAGEGGRAPVRVGVLGCASIAWRRTLPAMVAAPNLTVAAVASRDLAKAERFAAAFGAEAVHGYQELLERTDIEAVYLPLPTGAHHEWVARALRAGKHVLAEKPLATTAAEAAELVELAAKSELVLQENFMFLHHGQHRRVRELLDAGAIGELRSFTAAFGIPPLPAQDVRYVPELGGGALLDVGVYPIRAAQLFLDGVLSVRGAARTVDPVTGVDLAGSALLAAPGGATASLQFGFQHHYRNAYELWGSAGRISVDRVFTPPGTWAPILRVERPNEVEELVLPAEDQFLAVVTAFGATVREPGRATLNDGAAMLRQARLVDAVRGAATTVAAPDDPA